MLKLIDDLILTELGDGYVVVPTKKASEILRGIVRLNATGASIFRGLQSGLSENEIANKLVEEYDGVEYERALRDVQKVVASLKDEGLIHE